MLVQNSVDVEAQGSHGSDAFFIPGEVQQHLSDAGGDRGLVFHFV